MPARTTPLFPLFLNLFGAPVVVVGGGAVAERKARALVAAGARVTVIAKRMRGTLGKWKQVRRCKRAFRPSDLAGMRLVFAATDRPSLNTAIAALARERAVWVNVAAPPEAGSAHVPAVVRRGALSVAISTGGASAAAARTLRRELTRRLDPAWPVFLALLAARRARIMAQVTNPAMRRRLLQKLGGPGALALVSGNGRAVAARWMDEEIRRAQRAAQATASSSISPARRRSR